MRRQKDDSLCSSQALSVEVGSLGKLDPHIVVGDVVLKDATPLLRHAAACGCPAIGGQAMLDGQVDEMLAFFGM